MNYQLDKESYICVMLNFSLVYVFSYDIVIKSGHDLTFSCAINIDPDQTFPKVAVYCSSFYQHSSYPTVLLFYDS